MQLPQKDATQLRDNGTCRPRLGVRENKKPALSGRHLQVYLKLKFDRCAAAIKIWLLQVLRSSQLQLPLILGRDADIVVTQYGMETDENAKLKFEKLDEIRLIW